MGMSIDLHVLYDIDLEKGIYNAPGLQSTMQS
jgi:hypothetical protein